LRQTAQYLRIHFPTTFFSAAVIGRLLVRRLGTSAGPEAERGRSEWRPPDDSVGMPGKARSISAIQL
jgi:hypothetical protein